MIHKKRTVLIAVFATVLLAGTVALTTIPRSAQVTEAPPAKSSIAVETVKPVQVHWPLILATNGPLAAWQEAIISAETGGLRIDAVYVDVGARVKRGQVLAELASDTVKAELRKAEAGVASARAELREAQSNVRRGTAVRASGSLSGQQIEKYEIAEQTAAATLQAAEADLQSATIRLRQTRITAVDDGVISARDATLGTVVSSGTKLFTLVRRERVEWRAEVDAAQLARLNVGQEAEVTLPNGMTVKGRVRQLSPTLDEKTRAAIAYVELPKTEMVRAGIYASGRIALGERAALVLPSSAVTLRDGRTYIFEIDRARQIVMQREVTTGRVKNDQIEIVTGLKPGTAVVRSGGAFLHDGDAVSVDTAKESV
jgi:RND family efflux transporter MFP subunit